MAKTKFKKRVEDAIAKLVVDNKLVNLSGNTLCTPMKIDGKWKWMSFCESDGILARFLDVAKGEVAKPDTCSEVLAGVMIESEESTSDSLLNPWGKSCIPSIPNGVWIDLKDQHGRKRHVLTIVEIILVTPEPKSTTASTQKKFRTRKSILQRVESAAPHVSLLIAGKNDSGDVLAGKIWTLAEDHLT